MEPKLQTLPQYFKTETSPMIQHSAFPPFKIEHRYRGVYERAGFDVNLGRDSPTSDMKSTKSPVILRFPHPSNDLNSSNSTANSITGSMKNDHIVPGSAKTTKSFGELQNRTPYPVYENRAHSESQPITSQTPAISPGVKSTQSNMSYHQPQTDMPVNTEIPVVLVQHCDIADKVELPPPSDNGFTFIPSSTQNKNLKNLSLNLNDLQHNVSYNPDINKDNNNSMENESYETTNEFFVNNSYMPKNDIGSTHSSQSSIGTDELITSSLIQPVHGLPSPPPTSKSCELQPDNSLIKKRRLSSALNEFRKDIEDHKNYVPKTPSVPNSPDFSETPQLPTPYPPNMGINQFDYSQNPDSRISYNQTYVNSVNDDNLLNKNTFTDHNIEPSNQFQKFKDQQFGTDNQLNNEYQNFLQSGDKNQPRASQVSMVSSILSKDSNYEEDNGSDEAMECQLQALKVGENNNGKIVNENEHTAHDNDLKFQEMNLNANTDEVSSPFGSSVPELAPDDTAPANIPTFNIENIDEDDTQIVSNNSIDNLDLQDRTDITWETIKPSSSNHSEREVLDDFSNSGRIEREIHFDDPHEGVEVKPLSPKNHLVEEELKSMNFPMQQLPDYNNKEQRIDGFFRHPSGRGPCRSCEKEISPYSRGSQKAVFSKTGELSGQWHRSCFTCIYSGCTVQFSKSIQCYVHDDNAYCHNHYHELNDTLCQDCSKGIEGECVENELRQKWHLHCLRCSKCKCQINTDYYLINGASYCEEDAVNIIKEGGSYEDISGKVKKGGLTTSDKVEKRRTRVMYVE